MKMIEKMARALCRERYRGAYFPSEHRSLNARVDRDWPEHINQAKAALTTLLEPDEGMVEAMRFCTIRNSRPVDPKRPFESPFTAAIQHAIAEATDA